MSIYAYVGMPGSGKSYDVVANQIMPALKAGRRVVTNIPLHMDVVRQVVPDAIVDELPIEKIQGDPPVLWEYALPGCVLIIDECWRLWPAGLKADKVPEPFKKLLAEHRHMVDAENNAMQIVLVTQDLSQIAMFARQLVEQTFAHTKLSHVGASGSYRVDVYQGPRTGANLPREQRIREILGRYDKSVFKLYQSHTMSESGKAGANEKSMDPRGNIWRRPMLWIGAGFSLLFLVWGVPKAVTLLHNPTGRELRPASVASAPQPSSPGLPRNIPAPAVSQPVSTWRVSGVVHAGRTSRAFLTDGKVSVSVPFDTYCVRVIDGWTSCQWQGQEVTEWSAAPVLLPQDPVRPAAQFASSSPAS